MGSCQVHAGGSRHFSFVLTFGRAFKGVVMLVPTPYLLLLLVTLLTPTFCADWSYKLGDHSGPNHWEYECKKEFQSPVNIVVSTSTVFPALSFWNYELQPATASIENNGHTVKLSTEPHRPRETPLLSGGGLPHSYKFAQIHFHWGADDSKGSEHLVGDTQYPMEMHLVHYKAVHDTIKDALVEGAYDSLAVIGIFFEVSDQRNPALDLLLPYLTQIKAAGTNTAASPFPISSFFWGGDMSSFYRYNGSLTTPGCYEIVQWSVIKKPVPVTKQQLEEFRLLLTKEVEPLVDNFRPPQKLGTREILDVSTTSTDRPVDVLSASTSRILDVLTSSTDKLAKVMTDNAEKLAGAMASNTDKITGRGGLVLLLGLVTFIWTEPF